MKVRVKQVLSMVLLLAFLATTAAFAAPADRSGHDKKGSNRRLRAIVSAAVISELTDYSFEEAMEQIREQGLQKTLTNSGVEKDEFRREVAKIIRPRKAKIKRRIRVHLAKTLADLSGKSVEEIREMKTADNTWQDVMGQLGVDKEQVREKMRSDLQKVRDTQIAKRLAKRFNVSLEEVLKLKTAGNTWRDVVAILRGE